MADSNSNRRKSSVQLPRPPTMVVITSRIIRHPRLSTGLFVLLALLYHYSYLTKFLYYQLLILGSYTVLILVYPWWQLAGSNAATTKHHNIGLFPPTSFIPKADLQFKRKNSSANSPTRDKAVPSTPTTPLPARISTSRVKRAADNILSMVVRDFVSSWYTKASPDPSFPIHIESALRDAADAIYERCSAVDWDAFLTRRVMPLVTQHVADYRVATETMMHGGKKSTAAMIDVGGSLEADCQLARYFRNGNLHPAINTTPAPTIPLELAYLRRVVDCILPRLFSTNEVQSRLFSVLLREIIACRIIQPIVDSISDSDYWMQNIEIMADRIIQEQNLHNKIRESDEKLRTDDSIDNQQESDYAPTFDGFLKKIKKCNDLSEALQMRDALVTDIRSRNKEIEGMASDDVVHGMLVRDRRSYINQLNQALSRIEKRIEALGGSAKKSGDGGEQQRSSRPGLINLLEEPYLSYFMEHMEQEGRVQYLRFWLSVDGLRFHLKPSNATSSGSLEVTDWRVLADDVRALYNSYLGDQAPAKVELINQGLVKEVEDLIAELDERATQAALSKGASVRTPPLILSPIFRAQSDVWTTLESHDLPSFLTSQRYIKFSNQVAQASPVRKKRTMVSLRRSPKEKQNNMSSSLDVLAQPKPLAEYGLGRSSSLTEIPTYGENSNGSRSPTSNIQNNKSTSDLVSLSEILSSPDIVARSFTETSSENRNSGEASEPGRDARGKKKRLTAELKQAFKNTVSVLRPAWERGQQSVRGNSPTRLEFDSDADLPSVVNGGQDVEDELQSVVNSTEPTFGLPSLLKNRRRTSMMRRENSDKAVGRVVDSSASGKSTDYPSTTQDYAAMPPPFSPTSPTNFESDENDVDVDGRAGAFSQLKRKGREAARQLSPGKIFRRNTKNSRSSSSPSPSRPPMISNADALRESPEPVPESIDDLSRNNSSSSKALGVENDEPSGSSAPMTPSPGFPRPPRPITPSGDSALVEEASAGTTSEEDEGVQTRDSPPLLDDSDQDDGAGGGGESGNEEDVDDDDDETNASGGLTAGGGTSSSSYGTRNIIAGDSQSPPPLLFTTVVDGFDLPPIIPPPPHAVELSIKIAQLMVELGEIQGKIKDAEESGHLRQTIRDMRDWEGFLKEQESAARVAMRDLEAKELENFLLPGRIFVTVTDVLRRETGGRDRIGKPYAYQFQVHRQPSDRDESGWGLERTSEDLNKLHQTLRSRFPTLMTGIKPPRVSERRQDGRVAQRDSQDEILKNKVKAYLETLLRYPELCRSNEFRNFMASESIAGCLLALSSGDKKTGRRGVKLSPIYKRPFPFMFQPRADDTSSINSNNAPESAFKDSRSEPYTPSKADYLSVKVPDTASGTSPVQSQSGASSAGPAGVPSSSFAGVSGSAPSSTTQSTPQQPYRTDRLGSMTDAMPPDSDLENTKAMAAVMDLLCELFELRDRSNWFRRQAIGIAIQTLFSKNLEKRMSEALSWALSDDSLAGHLDVLTNSLWPGGVWWAWASPTPTPTAGSTQQPSTILSSSSTAYNSSTYTNTTSSTNTNNTTSSSNTAASNSAIRSKEQRAKTQYAAEVKLQRLLPELVGAVVGRTNARKGAMRLCQVFQNGRLDRELAYRLLDAFIDVVFPGTYVEEDKK
ncbi:hypothetical protein SmJEL517_g04309 [Synchytrium microbalum]|uniref:PXA domain-containing protein n=1 Tax=Synchytrium microbalum TaxID=1806994 RepID=A0A507C594_9FUNG|nr:uncharacterized protein SmJEL517_g04309 [Synchytrium microbalum]TPX32605.1 hypothetical protein SmJEL517_g04309 [Synchytrium microbalum]